MKLNNFVRSKKGVFILNFIILVTYALSGCIKYEVSDDFVMEMMVSGAYTGKPSPFIMFMNPIIGILLSSLYNIFGKLNWYFLFHIAIIFLSLCVLTYYFFKWNTSNSNILLVFIFLLFFTNDLYLLVQFTKTATLAISAGIVILLDSLIHNDKRKYTYILGFFFFSIGYLIRENCIFIVAFFAMASFLLYLFKIKFNKQKIVLVIKNTMILSIIGISLLLIFNIFNIQFNNNHPAYKKFQNFNSYRASIVDYNYYSYEENREEYEKNGISENDFYTLVHWNFGDIEYYDIDKLSTVSNILEEYRDNQYVSIKGTIVNLINREYKYYISFWGLIFISLINVILNKKSLIISFFIWSCTFLVLFINMYLGRLNYRVEFSVFLAAAIFSVFLSTSLINRFYNFKNKIIYFIIFIMIIGRIPIYIPNYENNYDIMFTSWNNDIRKYRTSFKKNFDYSVIDEIRSNPNNFYFLGFYSNIQTLYLNFDPLKDIATSFFDNSAFFAGVDTYNPVWLEHLKNNNIQNPMKSLLKENVYFIENRPINEVLKFIQEHYKKDAEMILYKQIGSYYVWKIR